MTSDMILDFNFKPGQKAKLIYWSGHQLETAHYIIIEVVNSLKISDHKWYTVKIPKTIMSHNNQKKLGVSKENITCTDTDHIFFKVDPDELEPLSSDLDLVMNEHYLR